jgi:hypothetical protein
MRDAADPSLISLRFLLGHFVYPTPQPDSHFYDAFVHQMSQQDVLVDANRTDRVHCHSDGGNICGHLRIIIVEYEVKISNDL